MTIKNGFPYFFFLQSNNQYLTLAGYECGFYTKAERVDTGSVVSPKYPSNYPNFAHCIWLIKAPKEYAVELTIHGGVKGHMDADTGECRDYLEVKLGTGGLKRPLHYCIIFLSMHAN